VAAFVYLESGGDLQMITTTSVTTDGTEHIALLSGGGAYEKGAEVTLTAQNVTGYDFRVLRAANIHAITEENAPFGSTAGAVILLTAEDGSLISGTYRWNNEDFSLPALPEGYVWNMTIDEVKEEMIKEKQIWVRAVAST